MAEIVEVRAVEVGSREAVAARIEDVVSRHPRRTLPDAAPSFSPRNPRPSEQRRPDTLPSGGEAGTGSSDRGPGPRGPSTHRCTNPWTESGGPFPIPPHACLSTNLRLPAAGVRPVWGGATMLGLHREAPPLRMAYSLVKGVRASNSIPRHPRGGVFGLPSGSAKLVACDGTSNRHEPRVSVRPKRMIDVGPRRTTATSVSVRAEGGIVCGTMGGGVVWFAVGG